MTTKLTDTVSLQA